MKGYKIILPKKDMFHIAPLNKRVIAFLIDILIYFFIIITPFMSIYFVNTNLPFEKLSVNDFLENDYIYLFYVIAEFACSFIFLFYLSSFELLIGATIGKKMMGLRVISKNKKKPSTIDLIIRNLSKSVLLTFFVFDLFLAIIDREHKKMSDYLSNTLVVEEKKVIKKFPEVISL